MPLIRVLLPAPLSPTRAVTRPGVTSRSTPCRTWTAPKLLLMPRSCSSGAPTALLGRLGRARGQRRAPRLVVPGRRRPRRTVRDREWCPPPIGRPGTAVGATARRSRCRAAAYSPVQMSSAVWKPSAMTSLHVVDVDRLGRRRARTGRPSPASVSSTVPVARRRPRPRRLDQGDRQLGGRVGLDVGVLVDRHALRAGEDPLETLDAGVLTGDRDLAGQAVGLEPGDDAAGHRVVGRDHAVDLAVVVRCRCCSKARAGLVGVPLTGLVADERVVARVDLRLRAPPRSPA